MWSSITSAIRPFMAPRTDAITCNTSAQPISSFERALDGFDLTADAPYPGQELGLFATGVGHGFTSLGCRAPLT